MNPTLILIGCKLSSTGNQRQCPYFQHHAFITLTRQDTALYEQFAPIRRGLHQIWAYLHKIVALLLRQHPVVYSDGAS